jgi:hypothetical protein
MKISEQNLNAVYDRTSGYCHICGKKLSFCNYGLHGRRGAWEIEHSLARFNGGSDSLCNLYPACIGCNRRKRHFTTRTAAMERPHSSTVISIAAEAGQSRKRRRERRAWISSGYPVRRGRSGCCLIDRRVDRTSSES